MRALFVLMLCGLIYSQGKSQYSAYNSQPSRRDRPMSSSFRKPVYLIESRQCVPAPSGRGQANVITPNVPSCGPVKQIITFGSDKTRDFVVYDPPTTTIARRCTGSCYNGRSCQRDRSRVVNLRVLVQRYNRVLGRWGGSKLENVPVEDHISCKCVPNWLA